MSANIRARDNRKYVRELLGERQPGLAAVLRAVERQIDQELSDGTVGPCGWRHIMNTAWLYHPGGSVCVDGWSCREQEHTSVPPRCGVLAADGPADCELPQGHPGPHLHLADSGAGNGSPAITGATVRRGHPAALAS